MFSHTVKGKIFRGNLALCVAAADRNAVLMMRCLIDKPSQPYKRLVVAEQALNMRK